MITEKTYKALCILQNTSVHTYGATPTSFGKGYFKDEWRTATQKKYRYAAALMLGRLRKLGYVRQTIIGEEFENVITKEGKEAITEYEKAVTK